MTNWKSEVGNRKLEIGGRKLVLYREEPTYWKMVTTIDLGKSIYLHTLDCFIEMSDIYRGALNLAAPQFKLDL